MTRRHAAIKKIAERWPAAAKGLGIRESRQRQ
jgi:hypothetical protein